MAPRRGEADEGQEDDRFLDEGDDDAVQEQDRGVDEAAEELSEDELEALEDGEGEGGEDEGVAPPRRRQPSVDPELERLRRENELLRRQPPPQQQQPAYTGPREETEEEFQQRIAQLEPVDQLGARQQRAERRSQAQLAFIQASTADQLDRASFQMRAGSDRRFAKYADEVERRHQALLMGGPNMPPQLVPRETILKIVLGEKLLAPASREQRRQQERQQRKADRQVVRPPNSRSDAGSGRTERRSGVDSEREARRKRLENLEI